MATVVITITDLPQGGINIHKDFGKDFVEPTCPEDIARLTDAQLAGAAAVQAILNVQATAAIENDMAAPSTDSSSDIIIL